MPKYNLQEQKAVNNIQSTCEPKRRKFKLMTRLTGGGYHHFTAIYSFSEIRPLSEKMCPENWNNGGSNRNSTGLSAFKRVRGSSGRRYTAHDQL